MLKDIQSLYVPGFQGKHADPRSMSVVAMSSSSSSVCFIQSIPVPELVVAIMTCWLLHKVVC